MHKKFIRKTGDLRKTGFQNIINGSLIHSSLQPQIHLALLVGLVFVDTKTNSNYVNKFLETANQSCKDNLFRIQQLFKTF